ncbi:MAG TPA: DUF4097 family beta strand repeat-containing protein [Chloroflexota bacterium]|nr:DUF4097 family beta strand repeat-containing protein [Chloroflexota bacterium]
MATATDELVEQEFEVGAGSELAVSCVSGRIRVRGEGTGRIAVRARKHGRERAVENTRIELEQEGNRVTARVRSDAAGLLGSVTGGVAAVDFEITVPEDCAVHAKAVSADVSVHGARGALQVESVSGDVDVADAGGARITTVSGDVSGRGMSGAFALNTTSGSVELTDSRLSSFNCHTVSGDLTIETPLAAGEHYRAQTVSGDLTLLVPAGTGATVQLKSVSGDVHSELPAEIIKAGRRHWQGRINGGGANVEMTTVSGDLALRSSSTLEAELTATPPVPPVPAVPPTPPTPPDMSTPEDRASDRPAVEQSARHGDTTAVLKDLEEGKISVEDALARLRELE